jgi:3-methyladenine DNA glycosylase AlkD
MIILEDLRDEMDLLATEENRLIGLRYFKNHEKINICGIKSAEVHALAKKYYKVISTYSKDEIFDLSEKLFSSGVMEESFIASSWLKKIASRFELSDFGFFEEWVDFYICNWASCDSFCSQVTGEFILRFPNLAPSLKLWAKSENIWMKRASAVSLILPLRRSQHFEIAYEIADILLIDSDDMVQKGYGWMLKVASQKRQTEVFEYVMKNKHLMPRTALRYAIEKMPVDLKAAAMKK